MLLFLNFKKSSQKITSAPSQWIAWTIFSFIILISLYGCQDATSTSGSIPTNLLNSNARASSLNYTDIDGFMSDPKGYVYLSGTYFLDYSLGEENVSISSKDQILWEKSETKKSLPANRSSFVNAGDGSATIEYVYTTADGKAFTTLSDAPILEDEFLKLVTGTKLFYEPNFKKWILLLSLSDQILFYNSTDFKNWKHVGNFGQKMGFHGKAPWRSPDLFQLKVDGNDHRKKWVLMVSMDDGHPSKLGGTQYFVGDFDGKLFVNNNPFSKVLWLDWGADNTGGQTTLNTDTNERIFIGRMNANKYAETNNLTKQKAYLTVPRKLELKDTYYGIKLFANPVNTFDQKRGSKISQRAMKLSDKENAVATSFTSPSEFVLEFSQKSNEGYTIELSNTKGESIDFSYNGIRKMYLLNRTNAGQNLFPQLTKQKEHYAPKFSTLPKINVRILIDKHSIEIFADDGLTVFSELIFPTVPFNQMKLWGTTGQIQLDKMEIYQLE